HSGTYERVTAADQPHEQEEPPGGPVALGGQRGYDAEPLGPVVQREPDDQDGGQADLTGGGAAADGQPFAEVVQTDADRDEQRQAAGRGPPGDTPRPRHGQFLRRHRARPEPPGRRRRRRRGGRRGRGDGPGPRAEPALVEHQAPQADGDAEEEQGGVPGDGADPAAPVVQLAQGDVHRLEGVDQDVPDQEDQDADGEGVEELTGPGLDLAYPAERQSDQDGHPGDEAEQQCLGFTHGFPVSGGAWGPSASNN